MCTHFHCIIILAKIGKSSSLISRPLTHYICSLYCVVFLLLPKSRIWCEVAILHIYICIKYSTLILLESWSTTVISINKQIHSDTHTYTNTCTCNRFGFSYKTDCLSDWCVICSWKFVKVITVVRKYDISYLFANSFSVK